MITINTIQITGSPALDFIRKEGVVKQSKELTSEEKKFVKKRMRSTNCSFEKNSCFYNSALLMMSDSQKIKYVEGVVLNGNGCATIHAWNEVSGKVVDVTLQNFGSFAENVCYYGVEIPQDQVRSIILKNGYPKSSIIVEKQNGNRNGAY